MPKFVTIQYGDRAGYDRTPQPVRDAAHEQDARLRSEGALIGRAGCRCRCAIRLRRGWKLAMVRSCRQNPIAGFAVIEAADLTEAIDKISQVPCAVAHGVVEVWPLA